MIGTATTLAIVIAAWLALSCLAAAAFAALPRHRQQDESERDLSAQGAWEGAFVINHDNLNRTLEQRNHG